MIEFKIRNIIRKYLKESYEQEILDSLLDKVSQFGIDSLNSHEKKLLNDLSKNNKLNSDNDLILHFLQFHFSPLKGESFHMNKIGKRVIGINYKDKNGNVLFELEVESEVLGIKKKSNFLYINKSLEVFLKQNFTISSNDVKKIITEWFIKETDIIPNFVDFFFVNEP